MPWLIQDASSGEREKAAAMVHMESTRASKLSTETLWELPNRADHDLCLWISWLMAYWGLFFSLNSLQTARTTPLPSCLKRRTEECYTLWCTEIRVGGDKSERCRQWKDSTTCQPNIAPNNMVETIFIEYGQRLWEECSWYYFWGAGLHYHSPWARQQNGWKLEQENS